MKKTKKGFILLEILVAMAVLSAGVLFLVQALSLIVRSNQLVRKNQFAALLIDNIYNRFYSQEDLPLEDEITFMEQPFRWEADISLVEERLKKIMLRVSWQERNKPFYIEISRLVIDNSP